MWSQAARTSFIAWISLSFWQSSSKLIGECEGKSGVRKARRSCIEMIVVDIVHGIISIGGG